jgi:Zn-dependent peptidase ImmA (M78 family)
LRLDHVAVLVTDFFTKTGISTTNFPIQIDEQFIQQLGKYLQIKNKYIQVVTIPRLNKDVIYGKIRDFEDHVDIAIAYSLNHCWQRFVICKELAHLILSNNEKKGITRCPKELIDGLFASNYGIMEADVKHEHFAAFFAVECLMPYNETKEDLDNILIHNTDIAEKYKVPLEIIEHLKTDRVKEERKKLFENTYEETIQTSL